MQARAPSTKRLYNLKWRISVNWCSSQGKDPQRCGIKSVLSILQGGLDRHISASKLKTHVAAISANHDLVEGRLVGKHNLVIRFLREYLQDLSVNVQCLEFGPADSHVVLRTWPGYVPK
ncbi:hypothetical protein M9458_019209, partial [Cirrhinus mrigala]